MSVDSIVSILWDVSKCLVVPIKRQFGYVMSSKSYANGLQEEVHKLANELERVHIHAEVARYNLRKLYNDFAEWQASAEKALAEAKDLLGKFEEASKSGGTLPDPVFRYQFSRKAKEKTEAFRQLTQKCSEFKELDDISYSPPAPGEAPALGNATAPTPGRREGKEVVESTTVTAPASLASTSMRDVGVFKSRAQIIRKIMDALANNSNSVVGVYGMGKVGKSILLVDVERRIREEKLFDLVAKADVSENLDIKRIQGEIAHALGLDIKNEEYINVRAERLHTRLENEEMEKKKVLIILDNLRKGLDLRSVGIPCGYDNKVIGCKLLLTSRNRDVLRREMRCDKDFLLGGLQVEEAKELFERIVGDKVDVDKYKPLVDKALHKCAGVPFLILEIAKRFKDADLSEWEDTLKRIEMSKDKGINDAINKMLQLSYDHLEAEVKLTLRLCVVYGVSEPSLENLVRYGVGLGLYAEYNTIEEARNRLSSIIRTLQASSLLLENEDDHGFKIHDLVREFVTFISSSDQPLLVLKDKQKFVTELSEDKLKNCWAICFPYVDKMRLPEKLDCPELEMFLLFTNNKNLHVPSSLFKSMKKVKVLSFTGIHLARLPSSFQSLVILHTLCLHHCKLDDVAILGELKELRILSFANSQIEQLPKQIGQLVELRLLELSYCYLLQKIEPGVLESLINLEELYMEDSFRKWNAVEQTTPTNACLIELNRMEKLRTLHLWVPYSSMLPEDLNLEKLSKYQISIGTRWYVSEYKEPKTLELQLHRTSDVLRKGCVQSILGKTDNLFLFGLDKIERSIGVISIEGFPKLKHLHVENSPSAHYILQLTFRTNFNTLESLILKYLINLEKLFHGHIPSMSFSALKVVRVVGCHKMEILFPLPVARKLLQLEEVEVVDCRMLQGIVEADDCGKYELPMLRVLKLCELPDIKSFFTIGTAASSNTSDGSIGTQIAFFNGRQVAFPRLETLEITDLDNLKYMFSPSMVKSLAQLRELSISDCVKMETIITEEEGWGIEASETLAFSNLTDLHLRRLESLTCFSRQKCSREARRQDRVKSCSRALFNREVVFPSLEKLDIFATGNIEMIWDKEVYFQHLKTLDVSFCDGLSHIFTPTIAGNLVELTRLSITNCRMLTKVIIEEGGEDGCIVAFKQLKYLELQMLTRLRCFSSGGYTLGFPLLQDVIVTRCLNMRFFYEGPIEAPKLDKVQVTKSEVWFWKENLNVTIQNMFGGMAMVASAEKLQLSEYPELIEKWHNQPIPIKSSWQLKSLVVDKCPTFINAIPSILMPILNNMKTLQVRDCESIEEIFDLEGFEHPDSTRVLPFFETLVLVNLPKLRQIWNEDLQGTMRFSSLYHMTLYKCNNLRHAFTQSMARCLPQLWRMTIKECGQMKGVIAEEEGQGSAMENITFPHLSYMELECLPNLTSFLLGKNHILDCPKLEGLTIANCRKMRSLTWQPLMASELSNPSLFTSQVQIPQLQQMVLSHMDFLRKIWTDNPLETLVYKNLREVVVQNCKSLQNLFPHWLVTSLDELRELCVESCGLEEIVSSGDDMPRSTAAQVLFPKLTSLALHDMPQLKSLCPDFPTSSWPSLQELRVTHCDKLNMLSFAALMNKCTQKDDEQDLSNQEAHSSFERDFPKLERLLLVEEDIMMIQDGKFHDEIYAKPKALTLACFHDKKAVFPLKFLLERFQNLESLEVFCSSFENIFPDEGFVDEGKHLVLENLRALKLSKLHSLSGGYFAAKILESIKTFEVWDCPDLTILFPAMTTFQNLTELVVKNCSGLVHLGTTSAIASLVHLTEMTITGCERMKEVVANDENREEKVIWFGKLKRLSLQNMPSLECFSPLTSCILRFPSLWWIEVEECPKMNIFSKGKLSTPRLGCASLFRYKWEWDWKGDLNATIRRSSAYGA